MFSSAAGLVIAFAVIVAFVSRQDNYKFSGGDWATGQPKPFFELLLAHC